MSKGKHVKSESFVRGFWRMSAVITLPIVIGYVFVRANQADAAVGMVRPHETVDVTSIKDCDTEDGTREDMTFPCKWDPRAREIFIEGDATCVIIFYRVEDGCPDTDASQVCVAMPTAG